MINDCIFYIPWILTRNLKLPRLERVAWIGHVDSVEGVGFSEGYNKPALVLEANRVDTVIGLAKIID